MFEDAQSLFAELNNKLKEKDLSLSLICVGGFVLDYYGLRGTVDIDAFYTETQEIKKIIYEVGERYKLNTPDELWINNSVQNLNDAPPYDICKTIYSFSNLKILVPPLEYIAGMKLVSGRENDIKDVATIIKYLKIKNVDTLKEKMSVFNFGDFDDAMLIESFGLAYGLDWLKDYYVAHEKELVSSIASNQSNYMRNQNITTSDKGYSR